MAIVRPYQRRATARDLMFFRSPHLWRLHPYLPVVRRARDDAEPELGVLYDTRGHVNLYGYVATVFLQNLFFMPDTVAALLTLPRCVYDTFDELADGGWTVD